MATVRDVAALAGVSISTVSRALSAPGMVSETTRERVERAVAELDYRPNAAAQALFSGRSTMVAVLAANTLRWGFAATLQGVEEAARAAGYTVMIAVAESEDPDELTRAVDSVVTRGVAGAIVIDFDAVGAATLAALPDTLPVVAASGAPKEAEARPHAYLDDFEGSRLATRHLLDLGHETVHHVAIPATRERSGREWGWRRTLEEAGASVPDVVRAEYDSASGLAVVDGLDPRATAVLCGNDELAIGVLRGLAAKGLDVPHDVSVMGFDDQPFAAMWRPALSTVRQDFGDLGRRTFGLLEQWMTTGERPADDTALPHLVLRESTASPA